MNDIFLACRECKVFADAGYRWAYFELVKTAVVTEGGTVNVAAVFAASSYWIPPDDGDSDWLVADVLPSVRALLEAHRDHNVTFGDSETIMGVDDHGFDWLDVGYLPELSPRYFVEKVGLSTWQEVCGFVATADRQPWWWGESQLGIHDLAKVTFTELVEQKARLGG